MNPRRNALCPVNLKKSAHELIDNHPDNASWDDVVYEMITRREPPSAVGAASAAK